MSSQLTRDIYSEISKYIPLKSQPSFRRINKYTSETPINWDECCIEPSQKEIADFIWEESQLLTYDVSAKFSVLENNKVDGDIIISLWKKYNHIYYGVLDESCTITIHPYTGVLSFSTYHSRFTDVILHTYQELYNLLQDTKLMYKIMSSYDSGHYEYNWIMLKCILFKRGRCSYIAEFCYYKLIAKYLHHDIVSHLLRVAPVTTKTNMKTLISRILPDIVTTKILNYLYGENEENYTAWSYLSPAHELQIEKTLTDYFNQVAELFKNLS